MSMEEALLLGLEALQKSSEEKMDAKTIEVSVIVEGEKFRRLNEQEIQSYIQRLPGTA